ncbi:AraC family transcriptional regulator [Paenibacillus hodogayensis]|uniref:AraC family transcriptional regulator n=1 Tax=Paenibacillus hodogayensis TaxID=279208 RepID=A0ABV5VTC5_9BACL
MDTMYMPDMDTAFRVYQTHLRVTKPHWSRPLHDHTVFEMNYLIDGIQDVLVANDKMTMQAGDVLLIPPGVPHRVTDTRNTEATYFALHFDVEDYPFRAALSRHRCRLYRRGSEAERVIRDPLVCLIDTIRQAYDSNPAQPSHRMKLVSQLFAVFAALGDAEEPVPSVNNPGEAGQRLARRMAEMIEESVRSADGRSATAVEHSIARISEKLGYSPSYCARLFRQTFGRSPRQHWTHATLHRARLELLDPDQPLERIAAKLGFQDGAHFSKQFKRWTGCSPSEYRQNRHSL